MAQEAAFIIGQIVRHRLFNYRGVIFDADPIFSESEQWYNQMAQSRPPKDRPWYHVLVHDAVHTTYVAERNLDIDSDPNPIRHPLVENYFSDLKNGTYILRNREFN